MGITCFVSALAVVCTFQHEFLITGAFKDYESIMVLTNGGPNNRTQVMFLYIYQLIFGKDVGTNPQIGYATVLSLVAALIIGIVTAVYMYFARKLDEVV